MLKSRWGDSEARGQTCGATVSDYNCKFLPRLVFFVRHKTYEFARLLVTKAKLIILQIIFSSLRLAAV